MADNPNPNPSTDPPQEPSPEQQTAAFWSGSKDHITKIMDEWFDNKVKSMRETSSSRTGRTTLPGILSDIMFGPKKD